MANDIDVDELMLEAEIRMEGAVNHLEQVLAGYRTGRASPRLLDRIVVEMYGAQMQVKELAVISVPEAQQLAIRPYDANSISAIERAIIKSDLGLMPNNDGKIIRLNLPRLTEERRKQLSKQVGDRVEEAKIAIRNVRRDVMRSLKDLQKKGDITEDDQTAYEDDTQKLTDRFTGEADKHGKE